MLPNEWVSMGGDSCFQNGSCADCAASEFDLVKKLGQEKADQVFNTHWETWFTEDDVKAISDAGLNTVRIPVSDKSFASYDTGNLSCHWLHNFYVKEPVISDKLT